MNNNVREITNNELLINESKLEQVFVDAYMEQCKSQSIPVTRDCLISIFKCEKGRGMRWIVYEHDNTIIGFATFVTNEAEKTIYISHVAVETTPAFVDVAAHLISHIVKTSAWAKRLTSFVRTNNVCAKAFYVLLMQQEFQASTQFLQDYTHDLYSYPAYEKIVIVLDDKQDQ
jgi:hypothetical protein